METQKKESIDKALTELKREYGDKYEAKAGLVKSILQLGG